MQITSDASLQQHNTLALRAHSRALVGIDNENALREALDWARANKTAVTVLGQGSNVVFAGDLSSLVLVQATRGRQCLDDDGSHVRLRVAAGENWHHLVEWTLSEGYFGLENLALIPGTVGAAPIQNIGAYGVELGPFVEAVHALRIDTCEAVTLSGDQCEFGYRDSIFKHRLRDQLVITAVDLRLPRVARLQLGYPALASALALRPEQEITAKDVFDTVVSIRRSKLPDPAAVPNAGSFFKNPVLEHQQATGIKSQFPDLPVYPQADGRDKIPAAWLIEYCGWKGHRKNGVGVHPDHALVLVNYGADSGACLLQLADRIAVTVRDTFGITLEIEPRVYGQCNG